MKLEVRDYFYQPWGMAKEFSKKEYRYCGHLGPVKLYEVKNADLPLEIGQGEGTKVEVFANLPVLPDEVAYSIGANACVAGVMFDVVKNIWLFHTTGDECISPKQLTFMETAVKGIIGGNQGLLNAHLAMLKKHGYRIIDQPDPRADFNIAVVRTGRIPNILPGIYFGYGIEKKAFRKGRNIIPTPWLRGV